jgi:hypothetical protein
MTIIPTVTIKPTISSISSSQGRPSQHYAILATRSLI